MKPRLPLLLFLLCLASRVAAQVDTTFPAVAGTRLEVNPVRRGSVAITAWTRSQVRILIDAPASLPIEINRDGALVKVEERRTPNATLDDARIRIWVPATTGVSVVTNAASVEVTDLAGDLTVITNSGDAVVSGAAGPVQLRSSTGSLTLRGARGTASLRSTATVTVERFTGSALNAETVRGALTLRDIRSTRVEASTHTGALHFNGALASAGYYDFASLGGDVELALAAPANATVTVGSASGAFTSDFPVNVRQVPGEKFTFTIGTGQARLAVITDNGSITLRKTP